MSWITDPVIGNRGGWGGNGGLERGRLRRGVRNWGCKLFRRPRDPL